MFTQVQEYIAWHLKKYHVCPIIVITKVKPYNERK